MTAEEIMEIQKNKEAKARATILEIVGDIPDADIAPPENVLFVCKLNPVTNDDDLEIIFSRFGKIIGYVNQFIFIVFIMLIIMYYSWCYQLIFSPILFHIYIFQFILIYVLHVY